MFISKPLHNTQFKFSVNEGNFSPDSELIPQETRETLTINQKFQKIIQNCKEAGYTVEIKNVSGNYYKMYILPKPDGRFLEIDRIVAGEIPESAPCTGVGGEKYKGKTYYTHSFMV